MKAIRITLYTILGIIIAILGVWGREIRTINTVKRVGDNNQLYVMEYKAKYDLDDVIAHNLGDNASLLSYVVSKVGKGLPIKMKSSQVAEEGEEMQTFNCTSFQAKNAEGDGYLYGRNYDYFKNPALVTISHPKVGYASISTTDMSLVGYKKDKLPKSFMSKVLCLASIYAPTDGMNEKGLCTSIMALPHQASQQDTEKPDVGTTIIMRLFLDRCATIDEAIALVNTVDVRHDAKVGSGYHYMVADANGDCAVIEFDKEDGWKTMIVRKEKDQNSMLVTNHLLSPKYYTTEPDPAVGNPNSHSWWRYETAGKYLADRNGILTEDEAKDCLYAVHWENLEWPDGTIEDTQYSNVYNQKALTLSTRTWNDWKNFYDFKLE